MKAYNVVYKNESGYNEMTITAPSTRALLKNAPADIEIIRYKDVTKEHTLSPDAVSETLRAAGFDRIGIMIITALMNENV